MPSDATAHFTTYNARVQAFAAAEGSKLTANMEKETALLVTWLGYLRSNLSHGIADDLLDALRAAILEACGCVSLGLVRPAIYAIRLQIEAGHAWLYFNDHPIEWNHIRNSDHEFPMRAQNVKYLATYSTRYSDRFKQLEAACRRKVKEPYSLSSAYVHGTSEKTMPAYETLDALVSNPKMVLECVALQAAAAEYISDVFAAWYADRWHDLPAGAQADIKARLQAPQLKKFCS